MAIGGQNRRRRETGEQIRLSWLARRLLRGENSLLNIGRLLVEQVPALDLAP